MNDIIVKPDYENALANLPAEIQAKILAASKRIQESAGADVRKISYSANKYTMPDGTETQSFVGVVVATKHANIHYPGEFDRRNFQPPDCIAVLAGNDDVKCVDLHPHEKVLKPHHANCANCPKFQFGSAKVGKGKACHEHTLLAVYIPAFGDALHLLEQKKRNSTVVDQYLKNLTNRVGHPMAVMTKFTVGEDDDWVQTFGSADITNPDLLPSLANRIDEANDMLYERVVGAYKRNDD
jgi:hypothetical protein